MNSKKRRINVLSSDKKVNSISITNELWLINSMIILVLSLQLLNPVPAFAASISDSSSSSKEQLVNTNGETTSEYLFLYQIDDHYYLYDPGLDKSIDIGSKTGWDRTLLSPRCSNCIENPQSYPDIHIEDGYMLLGGILSEDQNNLVYVENSYDSPSERFLTEFQMWFVNLKSGERQLLADNSNSSFPGKLLYPVLFDAEKELIYFESYDHVRMEPFSGIYVYKIKEQLFTEMASESDYYNSTLWVSPDNLYMAATGVLKGLVGDTPIQFSKSTTLLMLDFTQEIIKSVNSSDNIQILPQGWISRANSTILRNSSGIQSFSVLAVQEASSGFQRPMSNDHYGFEWLDWTAGYPPLVYHPGDDYNGPGNDCYTDISAVADGVVKNLNLGGWGTLVIEHNWQGITVYSQYGHLESSLVSTGDNVTKGQHIAEMGTRGAASCHLHWEIRQSDHPDPNNSGYYTTNVLNVKSNVENYYYDPEWWVDNHGSYNNNCNNPSPNSDQVGIYADANYCGSYKIFGQGEWANPGAMGFGNDSVSSVKVGGNVKAVLCKDDNYAGGCEEFTGNDSNLSDNSIGDNSVSSMKVQSRGSSSGSWTANYYDTIDRWWDNNNSGNYKCSENVGGPTLDKNYGTSGPCGMDGDTWIADYSATINFPSGNYVFLSDHDDGLKIWLNGQNIGDYGGSGSNDKACPARYISGNANLRALLREDGGDARVRIWWTTDTSVCVQPPAAPSLSSPSNNATVGRYDNVVLSWNSVSGASDYYAEFSGGPGYSVNSGWTSGTSYTIGSTFWGGVYTWRVKARNSTGEGAWSETRTLYRKYGTPSNLTLSDATQTQVTLSWGASADAPGNIDGYRIYRNGTAIATVGSSTTNFTDNGLSCNGNYSYFVRAYRGSLESDSGNTQSLTTAGCAAGTPILMQPNDGAIFDEGQSISLSWSDTGDEFYGEISGGPAGTLAFGWQNETSKDLGPQWAGYSYTWRVKARNTVGESGFSNTRNFTVRPGQPANLTVTSPSCNRVNLLWVDSSGNEQGYQVYRNTSLIATLGSNSAGYQDTSVSGESNYSYAVYAYRGTILSAASDTVSITTAICPPANDNIAAATTINTLPYSVTQSTRAATIESGEPNYPIGSNNASSVWFRFSPTATGIFSVDTFGSNYDTVLHVFERGSMGTLSPIQGDDDEADPNLRQSKILFTANRDTTYLISVTHYGNGTGGSLTMNMSQVPCASTSLCITATNPWYRPMTNSGRVFDGTGAFLRYFDLDEYGFGLINDLSTGVYNVVVTDWGILKTVENLQGPGYLGIYTSDLPITVVSLEDLQGNPINSTVAFANKYSEFYVGYSYVNSPLVVYASPDNYLIQMSNDTDKYLTYHKFTVQEGNDQVEDIYNVAQSPAILLNYHVQTVPSVNLIIWTGNSGTGLEMFDGQTAVISFPPDLTFWSDNIVALEDTEDFWYYLFGNGNLQIEQFRQGNDIFIGGDLQVNVKPYETPYGRGDQAMIQQSVKDSYGNYLSDLWTQTKTGTSTNAPVINHEGAREVLDERIFVKDNETGHFFGKWKDNLKLAESVTIQTVTPIAATVELLDPTNVLTYQESRDGWNGLTSWTIPGNAAIGTWTSKVTLNYLGKWQGVTSGMSTFEVRNTPSPLNDDINTPVIINNTPFATELDTFGATRAIDDQPMLDCDLAPAEATVWYSFTPAQLGTLHADTIGSDYDTVLAVWTGSRGNLTLVACNDDRSITPHDQDSELVATLDASNVYYLMVGKYNGYLTPSPEAGSSGKISEPLTIGAGTMQLHVDFSINTPDAAQLLSPNSTLVIRRPTFTWVPGLNSTRYLFAIQDAQGENVNIEWVDAMSYCTVDVCTFTPDISLDNGVYSWQVKTWNISGYGPNSPLMQFTIDSTEPNERKVFLPLIIR
ncbi:membrane proteins related to metalloendopeptidases [Longilinea arvoryzae]|uniref:Membrane proteins related to metalloendopeptidases n=1 Tax=Longilinea arvoryzae TaxID=360412 RepID=A0A0S7BBW4_9CHLR|nr:peptidoglycan DD-metalloendopeptidase family protein [Longilinea arvoryzae]GAP12617.1 membrane proteins related to metalloendopeptidases [Longilinea arvoryzae]